MFCFAYGFQRLSAPREKWVEKQGKKYFIQLNVPIFQGLLKTKKKEVKTNPTTSYHSSPKPTKHHPKKL